MKPGRTNLITDVDGLRVGNAEDHALKSGVTVLLPDQPCVASVAIMGGAPGTRETHLLDPDKTVEAVDAIVLSGGSAFGLEAASGVVNALREAGRGFQVGPVRVPIVPAAILFDLLNGGERDWDENPYAELGRHAVNQADKTFQIGTAGAGTGAIAGTLKGGLGSASLITPEGFTMGALVAANPFGSVVTPQARHFFASAFEFEAEFGGYGPDLRADLMSTSIPTKADLLEGTSNTTIAIVATDAVLTKAEAKRLATAAHDGIARAIVPAHTPMDGDLIFSVSTGKSGRKAGTPTLAMLGHAAAICLSRAIARAVFEAKPAAADPVPCFRNL